MASSIIDLGSFEPSFVAQPHARACNAYSYYTHDEPCACPEGTIFQNSTTTAIVGASAQNVKNLTYSFFDTAWFGTEVVATSGTDGEVGCTRTLPYPPDLLFVEELLITHDYANGSFFHHLGQADGPVVYNFSLPDGSHESGSFFSYWDLMRVTALNDQQTYIWWHVYACFTPDGHFADFHEGAINNLTSILKGRGQLLGKSEGPNSVTFPASF